MKQCDVCGAESSILLHCPECGKDVCPNCQDAEFKDDEGTGLTLCIPCFIHSVCEDLNEIDRILIEDTIE